MRLVIDCFKLVKGKGKSIGIYNLAQSLAVHLAEEMQKRDLSDEVVVLGNEYNRKDFELPGITFVPMKGNPLNKLYCMVWELFLVPGQIRKQKGDRVLFPRGYRPLNYHGKDTIIVHDLIPFYYHKNFPGVLNRFENAYIMNRLKASVKGADRVITISEYSKGEINKLCPGCSDKVRVIYNGLAEAARTERRFKASAPYIFAVASGLPHKNAAGILRAYDAYYHMVQQPSDLILVGIRDLTGYEISEEAAAHVTCHKFIEKTENMQAMMAGARAFLFLSLMEGFGFPPLEAMQQGVPVVCSNRSCLPEVVSDAGLLVDPDQPEEVANCLIKAENDKDLQKILITKGYKNVERFGWDTRLSLYMNTLGLDQ